MDTLTQMLPFIALGALGVATLIVAAGALSSARRSERLGEDRLELLREQAARLELMREERQTLTEELGLERRERLQAQRRVEQLTREHPHLELERELQRVTEELELEREGRLQQEVRDMSAELEGLWEEWHRPSKNSKSLWGSLFGAKSR